MGTGVHGSVPVQIRADVDDRDRGGLSVASTTFPGVRAHATLPEVHWVKAGPSLSRLRVMVSWQTATALAHINAASDVSDVRAAHCTVVARGSAPKSV